MRGGFGSIIPYRSVPSLSRSSFHLLQPSLHRQKQPINDQVYLSVAFAGTFPSMNAITKNGSDEIERKKEKEESPTLTTVKCSSSSSDSPPQPPEKPEPGDCCGNGCFPCVWDMYYEELEAYTKNLDAYNDRVSSKPN